VVFPIGDAPNPRGIPFATYLLIAANVAVFVLVTLPLSGVPADPSDPLFREYAAAVERSVDDPAEVREFLRHATAYDLFVLTHGFRPAAPEPAALFTSLFLHASLMHLIGNMLFLWIYGDNVEHRIGRARYLLAYLGTGLAATLVHYVTAPDSPLPTIGASGAISGVLGLYFVWFPQNKVRLLWLLPPIFMNVFMVPARIVLGFYLILDNLVPFLIIGGRGGGVAHGAHIGGFVAGVVAAWMHDRLLVRRGEQEVATHPGEDPLALAAQLRDEGRPDEALAVLERMVRSLPRGPEAAEAHVRAGTILLDDLHHPTSAYQHFATALEMNPDPRTAALAEQGIAAIQSVQKYRVGRTRTRRGAW
jgi:membrane associated rhomboid family serine protease